MTSKVIWLFLVIFFFALNEFRIHAQGENQNKIACEKTDLQTRQVLEVKSSSKTLKLTVWGSSILEGQGVSAAKQMARLNAQELLGLMGGACFKFTVTGLKISNTNRPNILSSIEISKYKTHRLVKLDALINYPSKFYANWERGASNTTLIKSKIVNGKMDFEQVSVDIASKINDEIIKNRGNSKQKNVSNIKDKISSENKINSVSSVTNLLELNRKEKIENGSVPSSNKIAGIAELEVVARKAANSNYLTNVSSLTNAVVSNGEKSSQDEVLQHGEIEGSEPYTGPDMFGQVLLTKLELSEVEGSPVAEYEAKFIWADDLTLLE